MDDRSSSEKEIRTHLQMSSGSIACRDSGSRKLVYDRSAAGLPTLVSQPPRPPCAEVAFYLKALLETNQLECLPKVSRSKGLQLYVPLNTKVDYAHTQSFAHAAAQALEKQQPNLLVSEMAKQLHPRKVFIDWSQNSDFKQRSACIPCALTMANRSFQPGDLG